MKQRRIPERIDEQASLWAARQDAGSLTAADESALEAWLEVAPEHRDAFERYRHLNAQIDAHVSALAASTATEHSPRWGRWVVRAGLSAAAAAAVIATIVLTRSTTFDTRTAERHVATLADGSRVELNARTTLSVDLRSDERRARLSHGEALFTIAPDAGRPFIVETPAGTVRVTGTVFNVRTTQGSIAEVTVLQGTVRVRPNTGGAPEAPVPSGSQAMIAATGIQVHELSLEATQDVVAWRHGEVVFADTPLAEVMERFAAYHARRVDLAPAVRGLRLGGRFGLDDLDGLLEAVEAVLPVSILHLDNGSIHIASANPSAQ